MEYVSTITCSETQSVEIRHPAKYSNALLPHFERILRDSEVILDPFAGTGKLRLIRPDAYLLEIEPEWAEIGGAMVGDALDMPKEWTDMFDAICTSPCYGNRMADAFIDHQIEKAYKRNTYTHALGRKLSDNNSGKLQWGEKYKDFHIKAWKECSRVLKDGGILVLNISDHIRNGKIQKVTDWHKETIISLGFDPIEEIKVKTPRMREGKNSELRVEYESILVFKKQEH